MTAKIDQCRESPPFIPDPTIFSYTGSSFGRYYSNYGDKDGYMALGTVHNQRVGVVVGVGGLPQPPHEPSPD